MESGEGGGPGYSNYLRKTDGSPAVRLGDGAGEALSPDGKWAVTIVHPVTDQQIVIVPTGVGEPKPLPKDGVGALNAAWLPDGKRIVFTGNEPGRSEERRVGKEGRYRMQVTQ